VRFGVLITMTVKITVIWDVTPYVLVGSLHRHKFIFYTFYSLLEAYYTNRHDFLKKSLARQTVGLYTSYDCILCT